MAGKNDFAKAKLHSQSRRKEADSTASFNARERWAQLQNQKRNEEYYNKAGVATLDDAIKGGAGAFASSMSGWHSPSEMQSFQNRINNVNDRLNAYNKYLETSDFSMDSSFRNARTDNQNTMNTFSKLSNDMRELGGFYSQFKSQGEFDVFNKYNGKTLTYDQIQHNLKQDNISDEERNFLSNYGINNGYNSLQDFDKDIADREARKSPIVKGISEGDTPYTFAEDMRAPEQDDIDKLKSMRNQYALDHKFDYYKGYMDAPDYDSKAQYDPSVQDLGYQYLNGGKAAAQRYIDSLNLDNTNAVTENARLQSFENFEYLTENEKGVYNYLMSTNPQKAAEYLKAMKITVDKRVTEADALKAQERAKNNSGWENAVDSLLSVVPNMVGGIVAGISNIGDRLLGNEVNPYQSANRLLNAVSAYREAVSNEINENAGGVWSFLYNTGMSMLDSAAGMAIGNLSAGTSFAKLGKNLYGISMGLGAGSQRIKELVEQGATEEQALVGGALSGIAEGFFEEYSLEKLISIKNVDTKRKILTNFLKQSFTEGSEEVFTEIANILIDGMNRGNLSDYARKIDEYMKAGMSEEEARSQTLKDKAMDVVLAGLGGAISGGVMGGLHSTGQYAFNNYRGKVTEGLVSDSKLVDKARNLEGESEFKENALRYDENDLKPAQRGSLLRNAVNASEVLLNNAESVAAKGSRGIKTGEQNFAGKVLNIFTKDDEQYLKTTEGEIKFDEAVMPQNLKDVVGFANEISDKTERMQFLANYDGKSNIEDYATAFALVYQKGVYGMSKSSINTTTFTAEQIDSIYEAGRALNEKARQDYEEQRTKVALESQKAIDKAVSKYFKKNGQYKAGKYDTSALKGADLTDEQWGAIYIGQKLFETMSLPVNVEYFLSDVDENGNFAAEQGTFKDNTIRIDARAGFKNISEGSVQILQVMSHELTHWAETKSPLLYKQLSDIVIDAMAAERGVTRDNVISTEMMKLEALYKSNDIDVKVTDTLAISELVARACEGMLTDEKAFNSYTEKLDQKQRSVFVQRVQKLFGKIADFFRDLASHFETKSKEWKELNRQADLMDKAKEKWGEMLADATKAGQADVNNSTDRLLAIRDKSDTRKFSEYAIYDALYDALSHGDEGNDNLIYLSEMPQYITDTFGISGDFYIYRNHAYENMVSKEQAEADGRPTTRRGKNIHFHNLGIETMKDAISSINEPMVAAGVFDSKGMPCVEMLLPVFSENDMPLFAALRFYDDRGINGNYETRPHLLLTVYETTKKEESSDNRNVEDWIAKTIDKQSIVDYDIKKIRESETVTSQLTRLTSISELSLGKNLSRFKSEINSFKEKNKINYSLRDSEGNTLSEQQAEYFADSKVRDKDGNLLIMYHGTPNEFTVFDPVKFGGKNGVQEGFGIYMSSDASIAKTYGDKTIKGYVNIANPARSDKKTLTTAKVAKLIEKTVKKQAEKLMVDGGYKSVNDAMKDTWVSNVVDTYSSPLSTAIREAAAQFVKYDENDMDIIRSIMATYPIRDYESAYEFYDILNDTLGFDGFITEWENRENGEKTTIALPLNSNQIKNVDNEYPTSNEDIRFSLRESANIEAMSMKYYAAHKGTSAAHISEDMLTAANEIVQKMTDYMLPFLDIKDNNGYRYLPEEILGKTTFANGSYGKTIENTTICYRTLAYIDFTNEIKKQIGRPLTVEESFLASQMLYDIAKEPQCLYCYVSLDRKSYDGFLLEYIKQRDEAMEKYRAANIPADERLKPQASKKADRKLSKYALGNSALENIYREYLNGREDSPVQRERFNLWIDVENSGEGFIQNADLTTEEVRADIKNGSRAAQVIDAERYAQSASWAKKQEQYRSYNGDILNMSDDTVKILNKHYGLRFYSFSEYTPAFIVENMQQIRDASLRGLYGLAYTKKTDFARIFANTGMNINISVFGKMSNGKVIPDTRQGADWNEVQELRKQYKNVGAVFVATSDELTRWAMAQEWIDVVIPFHIVRTGANVAEFYKWTNNTKYQADKNAKGKNKTITPAEHHNDLETFKSLIKKRGLTPRFEQFYDDPNYMKLVNETRLSDLESSKLTPNFTEETFEAAKKSFDTFVQDGGYYGGWYEDGVDYKKAVDTVAQDVLAGKRANEVDYGRQDIDPAEIQKQRKNNRTHGQFSLRDSKGKELTPAQQEFFANSKVRDEAGQLLPMYHGTSNAGFTVFKGENGISSRAFFFTDNLETARGYSGTHDIFNAKTFKNKAELIKAIEKDMRAENIEVKKTDAGYELYENGEYVDTRSNLDDLYQAYNEYSGFGGDSANYKVYLNVVNPLVIDAKGSNWEAIKVDFSDDTMTTNAIAEYALNNGYDGVIIRNVEDNGLYASSRNKFDLATDVIVFDSAQIKSVDNENPTGSDDIRYSLRDTTPLELANEYVDIAMTFDTYNAMDDAEGYNNLADAVDGLANDISNGNVSDIISSLEDIIGDEDYDIDDVQERAQALLETLKSIPNVRYSLRDSDNAYNLTGELEKAQRKNKALQDDVDRLKERLALEKKLTGGKLAKRDAVSKLARKFISESGIDYDSEELTDSLMDLFSKRLNEKSLDDGSFQNDINALARELAQNIKVEDYRKDAYNSLLKQIRNTKFKVTDVMMGDAVHYAGGKKELNRMLFGKIRISQTEGRSLDSFFEEMKGEYPELFTDTIEGDMIPTLIGIYNDIREAQDVVETYYDAEAEKYFQSELVNIVWQLPEVKTTADKWKAKVDAMRLEHSKTMQEMREDFKTQLKSQKVADDIYYGKTISNLRAQRDAREAAAREYGRQKLDAYRDRKARQAEIAKITDKAKTLMKWYDTNNKDKHIAKVMQQPVLEFLSALDFSSEQLLGRRGGEKAGTPTKKDVSLAKAFSNLATFMRKANGQSEKTTDIKSQLSTYLDIPVGYAESLDELSTKLEKVASRRGDNALVLNDLSLEELKEVRNDLTTLKSIVTNVNKLIGNMAFAHCSDCAQNTMRYVGSIKTNGKLKGAVSDFFNWTETLPFYAFQRFGEGGKSIFNELMSGYSDYAFKLREVFNFEDKVLGSKGEFEKKAKEWSEKIHKIEIEEGKTIQMTTAQIMSLYCINKRELRLQELEGEYAPNHLRGGGIRIADIKVGRNSISQAEDTKVSSKTINKITSLLTDEQVRVADEMQKFMSTTCSEWGNATSMKRFGIESFTEDVYFPIESDQNNIQSDATDNENSLFRLLNMSFTKSLTRGANNAVTISNIFDVFANHTVDMAKYGTLAIPVLDTFKWLSYVERTEKDKEGAFETASLKASLEAAFGKGAERYVKEFLKDLNGSQTGGRDDKLTSKLISNAKVVAVAFNLRVAALQPTAYFRAAAILSAGDMAAGFTKPSSYRRAQEHSGLAYWKSLGFYDINVQKSVQAMLKGEKTLRDKIVDVGLKAAEKGDELTWGFIWNACEHNVRRNNPDLDVNSEEFAKTVARKFDEVVVSTQVIDTPLTKSQKMRDKGGLSKLSTAFMAEPTVSLNIVTNAVNQFKDDVRRMGKGQAFAKNRTLILKSSAAYVITATVNAIAEAFMDAVRGMADDDDDEFAEAFAMKYGDNFWANFVEDMSLLAKIPVVKEAYAQLRVGDLAEYIHAEMRDGTLETKDVIDKWKKLIKSNYTSSRMDTALFDTMRKAYVNLDKAIDKKEIGYKDVYSWLQFMSQASGIPLSTLFRDFRAVWNDVCQMMGYNSLELFVSK